MSKKGEKKTVADKAGNKKEPGKAIKDAGKGDKKGKKK